MRVPLCCRFALVSRPEVPTQAVLKVTGPLEAGIRYTIGQKNVHTKCDMRAALSGLEDKSLADQAELRIADVIQQIKNTSELERTLKKLLEVDRCSDTAARHRFRLAATALHQQEVPLNKRLLEWISTVISQHVGQSNQAEAAPELADLVAALVQAVVRKHGDNKQVMSEEDWVGKFVLMPFLQTACRAPSAAKASSLYLLADSALQSLLQCTESPQHSATFKNCLKYLLRSQGSAIQVGEFFIPLRTCISCVGSSLRASRLETIVSLCGQACQQTQGSWRIRQQAAASITCLAQLAKDLQNAELAGSSETLLGLLSFLPQLIGVMSNARYDGAERVRATARNALSILEEVAQTERLQPESPVREALPALPTWRQRAEPSIPQHAFHRPQASPQGRKALDFGVQVFSPARLPIIDNQPSPSRPNDAANAQADSYRGLSGHSEYSAPRARPQQRQPEATVSEMSHLEELVLRSSTASAATLPHLRKVQTALMKASRMLGSSIDMAQAMRGSADFASSVQEDAASAPSFFGDRLHLLEPPNSHKKRLQHASGIMTGGNEQATPRKPVNTSDRSFTGRSSRAALKPLLEAVVHAAVDDVLNESASSQEELSPRAESESPTGKVSRWLARSSRRSPEHRSPPSNAACHDNEQVHKGPDTYASQAAAQEARNEKSWNAAPQLSSHYASSPRVKRYDQKGSHTAILSGNRPYAPQMTHPDSPLQTPSKAVRQELQSQGIDPLRESLDAFAALEGGPGGLLDFEAAAAVPEKELKKYLQASQIDGSLLANFRQARQMLQSGSGPAEDSPGVYTPRQKAAGASTPRGVNGPSNTEYAEPATHRSRSGEEGASTDVHCNPLYSEAKMKETRRSEALARVTRMLNAHMASSAGQASQNRTLRSGWSAQTGALPRQQRLEELTKALLEHKGERAHSGAERKLPLPGTPVRGPTDHKTAQHSGSASDRHNQSSLRLKGGSDANTLQDSLSRLRIDTSSNAFTEDACGPSVQAQYSKRHKRSRSISHDGRPTPLVQTPRGNASTHRAPDGQLRSHREMNGLPTYRRTPPQTPKSGKNSPFNSHSRHCLWSPASDRHIVLDKASMRSKATASNFEERGSPYSAQERCYTPPDSPQWMHQRQGEEQEPGYRQKAQQCRSDASGESWQEVLKQKASRLSRVKGTGYSILFDSDDFDSDEEEQ